MIYKGADFYVYMKKFKSMKEEYRAWYDSYGRWFGPNHVNKMASKADSILQSQNYFGEKKGWKWKKYLSVMKYNTTLDDLKEYRCQRLNLCHVKGNRHKYDKDFDTIAFLSQ